MGSFFHLLRGNVTSEKPSNIIVYDTETFGRSVDEDTEKHYLKVGVACCLTWQSKTKSWSESWFTFKTIKQFWGFVFKHTHKDTRMYLIAHNQQYDYPIVHGFEYPINHGWKMTRPIIDGGLFILSLKQKNRTIKVLDSMNWFKTSIKRLGELINKPKLEISFDSCSMDELEVYCRRDVEILKETIINWIDFIQEHNLGSFKFTIASQAFTAYVHRFMFYPIFIHNHKPATKIERDSYRGGRSESFFLGSLKQKVYKVDFNSLYPDVMQANDYPTKLVTYGRWGSVEGMKRLLKDHLVCARVKVKVSEPYLAFRSKKLLFPTGTFTQTLTTPELKHVLKHDRIIEVYDYAVYEKAPLFREYVDTLYMLKTRFSREGNKVYYKLTKLLLNTLYGKFGQRNQEIRCIGDADPDICKVERFIVYETGEQYCERTYGGKVYSQGGEKKEWLHSFPAISSHVTAYGRMKLWHYMKLAGTQNIFYCDTDSLFVNHQGYSRLKSCISDTELGKLKLEDQADSVHIFGVKDYVFGSEIRRKGIRSDAKVLGHASFKQKQFYKFRSLLRENSLNAPIVKEITKTLKRIYDKGILHEDGRVTPFVLPMTEQELEMILENNKRLTKKLLS